MPDPDGRDIKFDSLKTNVAFKFMIILQNLTIANRIKCSKSKYDRKLPEPDVLTMGIRYRVNGV